MLHVTARADGGQIERLLRAFAQAEDENVPWGHDVKDDGVEPEAASRILGWNVVVPYTFDDERAAAEFYATLEGDALTGPFSSQSMQNAVDPVIDRVA